MSYSNYGAMSMAPLPAPLTRDADDEQRYNMAAAMKYSHEHSDAGEVGTKYQHSYATMQGEEENKREATIRSHGFLIAAILCMLLAFGWLIQQVPPSFHPDKGIISNDSNQNNAKEANGGDGDDDDVLIDSILQNATTNLESNSTMNLESNSTTPLDSNDKKSVQSDIPGVPRNGHVGEGAYCSSFPECADQGLFGECCPTKEGINLECCGILTDDQREEMMRRQRSFQQGN